MPAIVTRLRIAGFKSFADPTTIDILPGLTGIVGPNGCGKSNVVEALRWAMGETSARSLRGGEMDEVIFAGSAARPSRNVAEVVVTLDDAAGLAPAPLHGEAELQVSRQIERGAGSTYRVNGREMRARDVQTMFADIASGARSSAMVSQGRVAFLVDARPEDRRAVLEEAAGITGLHARRHEAEIRLRAAETNLGRVGDLRSGLEDRHATLARQAEAARSYRRAVDALALAERGLLGIMLGRAQRAAAESRRAVTQARAALSAAERAAVGAETGERQAETTLGESGEELSLAATLVERARAGLETVEAEAARAAASLAATEARLAEATRDQALAAQQSDESDASLSALIGEAETLRGVLDGFEARHRTALAARDAAGAAVAREADQRGARIRADQDVSMLQAAHRGMASRLEAMDAALAELDELSPGALEDAAAAVETAERATTEARAATLTAEADRRAADDALALVAREEAALRDNAARAAAGRDGSRARRDRIAGERDAVMARCDAARTGMIAPGAIERARGAASAALDGLGLASEALDAAESARAHAEEASLAACETAREERARARDIASDLDRLARERGRLQTEHAQLQGAHAETTNDLVERDVLIAAHEAAAGSLLSLADARGRAADAERGRDEATASAAAMRAALMSCDAGIAAARTEIATLAAIAGAEEWSLLSGIEVPETLERAVAAGLGDALAASLDPRDARHWLELGPLGDHAPLPEPAVALAGLIDAPAALRRALSQIGLIDDAGEACALQATLAPGQALVSREGALFRWDGHVVGSHQPSPVAERLRARRRLDWCETSLAEALAARPALEASLAAAATCRASCELDLLDARGAIEVGERAASAAAARETALAARDVTARARADSVGVELARVAAALAEVCAQETAGRAADGQAESQRLSDLERAASSELDRAVAAERHARESLRTAEAMQSEMDAEARRLARRDEETAATLGTLEHTLAQLDEALTAALAELADADARHAAGAHALDAVAQRLASAAGYKEGCRLADAACLLERAGAEAALEQAKVDHANLLDRVRDVETRRALLTPERASAAVACAQSEDRLSQAMRVRAMVGPEEGALDQARHTESGCQRRVASLEAEAGQARTRLDAIASLAPASKQRRDDAIARMAELGRRLDEIRRAYAGMRDAPAALEARRQAALRALENAEQRRDAASRRALAEQDATTRQREVRRRADLAVASAREALLRAEAAETQAAGASADVSGRVLEAGGRIEPVTEATGAMETQARQGAARALAERDAIGPVNLLAEAEADEVGQRLTALVAEAVDLEEAVGRLRGSIGHLNREGRERLSASFVQIDAQFRSLFGRMFDGGRAHLALVGSDDPLEAGLEIYAQPPGKKLATLSLLSGGEQALTALSLIFAAFRCNPAPVCVLDEVDAPLDDANVERFCRLVSDMARETATRFLVVTHHQLTMANMDRLYGVTMQERGVSRLLSVDLGRAVEMTAQS